MITAFLNESEWFALSRLNSRLTDTALCAGCISRTTRLSRDRVVRAMMAFATRAGRCDECHETHIVYRSRLRESRSQYTSVSP